MGEYAISETNLQQAREEQAYFYSKRIGAVFGDFEVVEVWYDWESRKQMWKLKCTKCGKTKVTHNGREYVKGKNKGNCTCDRDRAKDLKKSEKIKKAEERPENPKWVGQIIGTWKVIEFVTHKGWLVECQKCGRQTYHPSTRIRSENPPLCTCENAGNDWSNPTWLGKRFGHLVIEKYIGKGRVACRCDCGNVVNLKGAFLLNGQQKTCGKDCSYHHKLVRTHGLSNDRLFRIWSGMRQRCYNPKSHAYRIYGGRGISICDEWRDDVFSFRDWALSHGYADDLSIDRIDCDKGYSPDNCRWATAKEQANNQHPRWTFTPKKKYIKKKVKTWVIDGEEKPIREWCEEYGLAVQAVLYRINVNGMSPKEALTTPKHQGFSISKNS